VALLAGLLREALQFLEFVGREMRVHRGLAGGLVGVAVVLVVGAGAVGLRCSLLPDPSLVVRQR
jgi:threonine dehydrogenase-like Zn-dependent dehydrogenase